MPLVRRNSLQTQGKLGAKNFLMHAHKPFSKTLLNQASRQQKIIAKAAPSGIRADVSLAGDCRDEAPAARSGRAPLGDGWSEHGGVARQAGPAKQLH
jgi:hypothetical protein